MRGSNVKRCRCIGDPKVTRSSEQLSRKKKAERKCICIHTHEPSPQELRPKNEQKKEEKKAEENIRYVCVYVSSGQGSRLNSRRPSGKKRKKKVGKRKNKEKKADWGGQATGYSLHWLLLERGLKSKSQGRFHFCMWVHYYINSSGQGSPLNSRKTLSPKSNMLNPKP